MPAVPLSKTLPPPQYRAGRPQRAASNQRRRSRRRPPSGPWPGTRGRPRRLLLVRRGLLAGAAWKRRAHRALIHVAVPVAHPPWLLRAALIRALVPAPGDAVAIVHRT